ncbi:pectinesterase-like [Hordeum vulgare subsp. vulgare]|uniref:pectinesterase-like n=1 Tax=Hordeum vulgare subsp. vulgare TaxID=112509 RepID=UPI001D1A536A|nr:pectinesterase-like [Hordeum vulgare subsp. vulgare]
MPPRKLIFLLALAILVASGAAGGGAGAKGRGAGHAGGGGAKGRGGGRAGGGGAKGRGGGHAGGGGAQGILAEPHRTPDVVVALPPGLPGAVTSIADALKLLENKMRRADGYFVIYIKAGEYKEYLNITTENVVFFGDGMDSTIITGSRSKKKGFNTELSATVAVLADGFMARDLSIQNTAGDPVDEQAVALLVSSGNSVFFRCDIRGYQDTLFAKEPRVCVKEPLGSVVLRLGSVDLSEIVPIDWLLAPNTGFIFQSCSVDISPLPGESLTGMSATYLGRPWQSHARVVFMFGSISSVVHLDGWTPWNGTSLAGGKAPLHEHEKHMYFASYKNHVLGSKKPVYWHNFTEINTAEEKHYTPKRFLHADSWLRATGLACYLGLEARTKGTVAT